MGTLLQRFVTALAATGAACAMAAGEFRRDDPLRQPRLESVGRGIIPRDVVASLSQDLAGFIWIATGDGLVRYDGYRFRPQERESERPTERNMGWVQAQLVGRDGRLWIGTESEGLAVYDPARDRVTLLGGEGAKGPGQDTILALAEGADGAIWVGQVGGGLQRYEPDSGRFKRYRHDAEPGSLPDDRVQALRVDRQGTLWIGSWMGLSRLRAGSERFETVGDAAGLAGRNVQALFEASDGALWIGSAQGDLARLDPRDGRLRMLHPPAIGPALARGAVTSLAETSDGLIWVGRRTGIDLHDRDSGAQVRALRHDRSDPHGLAGNEVTSLLVDRAGHVWIGGFGVGLQRYNPAGQHMWVRGADSDPSSPLVNPDLRAVLALADGQVWVATHTEGVARLDADLRFVAPLPPPSGAAGPWRVTAMSQASDGSAWLAGGEWLAQYSAQGRLLRQLPGAVGAPVRMLHGQDGTLWLATEDGLYTLRNGADTLVRIRRRDKAPLVGRIMALAEGPSGSIWAGSLSGLLRVQPGDAVAELVAGPRDSGLANPVVGGLMFDDRQTLWLDTAVAGLHHLTGWEGGRPIFDRVSARHGVVNRPFGINLLLDRRGRIWSHIHVYDRSVDRLYELTAADGVNFGTGWFTSFARTPDGRFLFGGSRGLLVVHPERFDASSFEPPVVLSELRINGERRPATLHPLDLQPGQRSVTLEFAALDFSEPQRLRYAYKLEGFDPDWIETGASFRAPSYSNLPPGDYVFQVRGSNRSGVWSSHELSLPLHVHAAWWQTWTFRALLLLMLGGMVAALLHWRTVSLRRRQTALQQLVQQRTAELEDASRTDPLTGLRNRRFLTERIDAVTSRSAGLHDRRTWHGGADDVDHAADAADLIFFLIDIDHFKWVNDTHGHHAGDAVIVEMRSRLQSVFRESDYLVRWGGEEFLVVACDTPRSQAPELAERMRRAVADRPFMLHGGLPLHRSCSIGFACFPLCPRQPHTLDWHATIRVADAALYLAKQRGRNAWLGLVRAEADSAAALVQRAGGPLEAWLKSGEVESVSSGKPGSAA